MGKKERFAFYLTPEKKAILERRYREDGSRSMTAFIERAVDFYLDYLSANDAGLFLPTSIKSYLDGRLGQLEDRLSSIAFRQAVEQDMVAGIWANAYRFSDEDLRRRRAESLPLPSDRGRIWAAVPALWGESFPPPGLFAEDEKKSRIKAGVAGGASGRSLRPAVRVVTGFAVYQKWGQKQAAGITFVVIIPELLLP